MEQVRKGLIGAGDVIKLIINMDGIPLSDSSLLTLWPILEMVVSGIGSLLLFKFLIRANIVIFFFKGIDKSPFEISLHCGPGEPDDLDDYVNPFIDEMKEIERTGICIRGEITYPMKI